MEKLADGSYYMTMDEFIDIVCDGKAPNEPEESVQDENNEEHDEVPLEMTDIQLLMLQHSIVVHNYMMDVITKEEGDLLMDFAEKTIAIARKMFKTDKKAEKEEK